uniref:Uncharacterized protein n=1 Tax=Arundo donax TaxID=35708 RepID=A0A0A9HLR0_ARUDO
MSYMMHLLAADLNKKMKLDIIHLLVSTGQSVL